MHRRLIEDTAPGRRVLLARAARVAFRGAALPSAVRAALSSIADGLALPLERAFLREAELYAELLVSDGTKSLIHSAMLDAEATHPHPPSGRLVERVGVLGAQEEGIELAALFGRAGLTVRLKDERRGTVATSVNLLRQALDDRGGRPGPLPEAARTREERVEGTAGFGGFGVLDLVVAAPEARPETVLRGLTAAEEHVSEACLLASASPLLPVADLAAALSEPSRALGLVMPRRADLFPVVEIVAGPATAGEVVATACRLAMALGRTPLHVSDAPGFLVHRLLAVFLVEATRLIHEGATVDAVDGEMEEFGFTIGPLRRIDTLGIAEAIRLTSGLSAALGTRLRPTAVMLWLADRKARLYRYRGGSPTGPNPELPARSGSAEPLERERIRERLLLALLNEGARALDEGVVASAADVDLAITFGIGYPTRRGGLLYQADRGGLSAAADRLAVLASAHGETFVPAPLLHRLASADEGFYPARPLASGHASG